MIEWIEEIVAQGTRRPGYPADRWTEQFIFDKFEELGLRSVRFEPVESSFWKDSHARLSVVAHGQEVEIECFPVPLSEPIGVEGPLAMWDPTDPGAVAGKVAIYELRFGSLPSDFPVLPRRAAATTFSPDALVEAGWAFDPEHTFVERQHRLPFAGELQDTMEPAIAAGAIGYVGVLRGYPSGGCEYYVPYDGRPRPIPGVYVSERDGDRLLELAEDEAARASLDVVAERGKTTCRNVVAELPGADDDWVIIGTHHDAPWASAVEDGTGISFLLAQAAAWAAVPENDRPHRLIFLATAAHMSAAAGTSAFIERHRPMLDRTVLEVHLEHAALDSPPDDQDLEVKSAVVTPRWWFTTEIPMLEQVVWDAIVDHHLDRSLVLTPDAIAPFPTTDGGLFHLAGVPLVNYLAAPWYLFDPADTVDKVDRATLSKVSRAAYDIVRIDVQCVGQADAGVGASRGSDGWVGPPLSESQLSGSSHAGGDSDRRSARCCGTYDEIWLVATRKEPATTGCVALFGPLVWPRPFFWVPSEQRCNSMGQKDLPRAPRIPPPCGSVVPGLLTIRVRAISRRQSSERTERPTSSEQGRPRTFQSTASTCTRPSASNRRRMPTCTSIPRSGPSRWPRPLVSPRSAGCLPRCIPS
jgi:hypothetical protein